LVRAQEDQVGRLFLPEAGAHVKEIARSGDWVLFENAARLR